MLQEFQDLWSRSNVYRWQQLWDVAVAVGNSGNMEEQEGATCPYTMKTRAFSPKPACLDFLLVR